MDGVALPGAEHSALQVVCSLQVLLVAAARHGHHLKDGRHALGPYYLRSCEGALASAPYHNLARGLGAGCRGRRDRLEGKRWD